MPESQENNEEIEINSCVQFPGQSIEPLLGSALRIQQLTLSESQMIVVEFKESKEDKFSFQYQKN
jgi:hypothetical protein